MEYIILSLLTTMSSWLFKFVGAGMLLFLGLWLIGHLSRWSKKFFNKSPIDPTLSPFLVKAINLGLKVLLIISVVGLLGIQTTSFAAILVGASLAIGNAFNGSLGNLASGIMLLTFRPFKLGDFIETNGVMGTVKEISLFVTVLSDSQNRSLIIPNSKITSDTITNFSVAPSSRVDISFSICYGSDIEKAKQIVQQVLNEDPFVMKEPAPRVGVEKLGENRIEMIAMPYSKTEDYWTVYRYTKQKIVEALVQEGYTPSYTQRIVCVSEKTS